MATTRSELEPFRQGDSVLDHMLSQNMPLTREQYISLAHAGRPPEPWTMEHESEIPEPLQDASKV